MAESSIFWPTGTTGDGASPYTDTQLFAWLRRTFTKNPAAEAVLRGYANELQVTAGSGKVTVGTGAAYVYGIPYENNAALDIAIPTPSSNTRYDRIVLRADWTAKTVRLARLAGAEGGGYPTITQTPGSIYEVIIANVEVKTSGQITVTNTNAFCNYSTIINNNNLNANTVATSNIIDGNITTDKLANEAVTTDKLASGAVTSAKIASLAISNTHISNSADIAQSKIDNTTRAIDADKVDGSHASAFAAANDMSDLQKSYSAQKGTSWTIPSDGNWYDISGLSLTINVSQACDLFIYFTTGNMGGGIMWRAVVDSTAMEEYGFEESGAHWYFGNTGSGSHTIKIQAKTTLSGKTMGNRRASVIVIPR